MFDSNEAPFSYLPLQKDELFDLSCEYLASLFERISLNFDHLNEVTHELTKQLFFATQKTIDFNLLKLSFRSAENLIDTYAKIVKCVRLSMGQDIGKVKSKYTVFKSLGYSPNSELQSLSLMFRNTQQHFEERLQAFDIGLDPFVKLVYSGANTQWEIWFGKGGYRFSNQNSETASEFNIQQLSFQSYKIEDKKLMSDQISIGELWMDVLQIINLMQENIQLVIDENSICCPPIRHFGVTMTSSELSIAVPPAD